MVKPPVPVLAKHKLAPHSPARTVTVATPSDLSFVVSLQKTWSDNVGFMTTAALKSYINDARILLVLDNRQPAGYLAWTCTKDGLVRIIQLAISPELLRTHLGTKLTAHLIRAAKRGSCSLIRGRSRSNLDSNYLLADLNFQLTGIFLSPTKRSLPLLEWSFPLLSPNLIARAFAANRGSFRSILKSLTTPCLRQTLLAHNSSSEAPLLAPQSP